MEEVVRKLYLSETPSIGWEAKTLGAKRRISSSEIATVPGTLDLVELSFSSVLMLVDWLVGSVSRSREMRSEVGVGTTATLALPLQISPAGSLE
jgi:hypothetical protein